MTRAALLTLLLPILFVTDALGSVEFGGAAAPASPTRAARGQRVYVQHCAACHGGGGNPGSIALAVKYAGAVPPLLTDRKDLSEDLTKSIVRGGIANMPFYRKTEISDAELGELAAYLARNLRQDAK